LATTDPTNPDTDSDTVNDGADLCVLVPGTGVDGCPVGPVNLPPTCDIYYSIEADGLVAQGDAVIPGLIPGSAAGTIAVPEGSYYIIVVCVDPEGDDVEVTINNNISIGPTPSATVGILVNIAEGTEASFEIVVEWTDGVNILTATITIELEEDSSGGGWILPGFTSMLGIVAMLGAALLARRRD
jgi:PGF-CTERM protein